MRRPFPRQFSAACSSLVASMFALGIAPGVHASGIIVTVAGTVAGGYDGSGVFGPRLGDLTGKAFKLVFTFDGTKGHQDVVYNNSSTLSGDNGTLSGGSPSSSPGTAVLTIDSQSFTFGIGAPPPNTGFAASISSLSGAEASLGDGGFVFYYVMDYYSNAVIPLNSVAINEPIKTNGDWSAPYSWTNPSPLSSSDASFSIGGTRCNLLVETVTASGSDAAIPLPPVTILDPVPIGDYPGLLNGSTITPTKVALAAQGAARTVGGVAADGIAQVVFEAPTLASGDTVTAALLSACTDPSMPSTCTESLSSDDNGGFFTIGTPVSLTDQLSNTTTDTADSNTKSTFFAYRAPIDFVRPSLADADSQLASRMVYVQFNYATASGQSYGSQLTPLIIVRPPVVLIHGIWSSPASWKYFSPLVTSPTSDDMPAQYDSRFTVYSIDYSANSADHVLWIESMANNGAFDQLTRFLISFKTSGSACGVQTTPCIAAVQADIVAHSLGGLITRAMVLDTNFFVDTNFQSGYIHKLITIGTPHNGTPIANGLLASPQACKDGLALFNHPVRGAVKDLASGSSLIAMLNTLSAPSHIKAHAIVGIANSNQESSSQSAYLGFPDCTGLLTSGGYQELFNGASDLLVPAGSQSFGFPDGTANFYGGDGSPGQSFIHSVGPFYPLGPDELNKILDPNSGIATNPGVVINPGDPTIPNRVIELLNTQVNNRTFAPIAP